MYAAQPSDLVRGSGADPRLSERVVVYLFAFADRDRLGGRLDFSGIADARPVLHVSGALAAVVCTVPLADYSGPAGERNLADIAWLAPRIREHGLVLQRVMRHSPLFPAPFGTLYTDLPSLTEFMRRNEAAVASFFDAVAGAEEWGLKAAATLASRETLEAQARLSWTDWASMSPGTRYLRLCRERRALIEAARARARRCLAALVEELGPCVLERRELACKAVGEGEAEPIGSYALLVRCADAAELADRVGDLRARAAEQHIALSLSGPWPPFGFRPNLQR